MIFDKIITADSEVDRLKMESVRQYHLSAIKAVEEAPFFDKKAKTLIALRYSLEYIGRCQATFDTLWEELFAAQKAVEKHKLNETDLRARMEQQREDIDAFKKLLK